MKPKVKPIFRDSVTPSKGVTVKLGTTNSVKDKTKS